MIHRDPNLSVKWNYQLPACWAKPKRRAESYSGKWCLMCVVFFQQTLSWNWASPCKWLEWNLNMVEYSWVSTGWLVMDTRSRLDVWLASRKDWHTSTNLSQKFHYHHKHVRQNQKKTPRERKAAEFFRGLESFQRVSWVVVAWRAWVAKKAERVQMAQSGRGNTEHYIEKKTCKKKT